MSGAARAQQGARSRREDMSAAAGAEGPSRAMSEGRGKAVTWAGWDDGSATAMAERHKNAATRTVRNEHRRHMTTGEQVGSRRYAHSLPGCRNDRHWMFGGLGNVVAVGTVRAAGGVSEHILEGCTRSLGGSPAETGTAGTAVAGQMRCMRRSLVVGEGGCCRPAWPDSPVQDRQTGTAHDGQDGY